MVNYDTEKKLLIHLDNVCKKIELQVSDIVLNICARVKLWSMEI